MLYCCVFKQKTAYELLISDWSSDVCSSDLAGERLRGLRLRLGLSQSVMAARIGISNSYLSQLEHDDRPMTPSIRQAIGRAFPLNGADFEVDDAQRRTSGEIGRAHV